MRNVDRDDSRVRPLPRRREALERGFFFQSGALSLGLHCMLFAVLIFGMRYSFPPGARSGPYRVSIMPLSSPGGGAGKQAPVTPAKATPQPQPVASTTEKEKRTDPVTETTAVPEKKRKTKERISQSSEKNDLLKSKKEGLIEGLKPSREKKEKEETYSPGNLQQALEEIRKQAALDKIKNRVDRRSKTETRAGDPAPKADLSAKSVPQGPTTSPAPGSAGPVGPGPGGMAIPGAGTGGPGAGIGEAGGPGSIFGFGSGSILEARLSEYYGSIWIKIKKEWTIPGNMITKKEDLEAIVMVTIDRNGKIQKTSFDKRSGNSLYDKMAIRAINKAEPFPPLPKEWKEDVIELGFRFLPD